MSINIYHRTSAKSARKINMSLRDFDVGKAERKAERIMRLSSILGNHVTHSVARSNGERRMKPHRTLRETSVLFLQSGIRGEVEMWKVL
jgi:hypothetical protein